MDHEALAITLTFVVHVVGVGALVWHLLGHDEERPDWRWWLRPGDDDGPRRPTDPAPGPGGDGLPLPDAQPSAVRLREPGRLGDAHPAPPRRPAHAPRRTPQPAPAGDER